MVDNMSRPRASKAGPISVVGYIRVSSEVQVEDGYGLAVQHGVVEAFCAHERLRLVEVASDPGVSGTTPLAARDGLSRAFELVSSGKAKALVVPRVDRLGRDALVALMIERTFQEAGGGVLYCEGGVNGDDDHMRLMRHLLHGIAEYEKRQLVARLTAGKREAERAGRRSCGRPPFGYTSRGGVLYVKADEAEVVRWIFGQVAAGKTTRQIARLLDHERTLGRRWSQSGVGRIVGRDTYKRGPMGSRIVDAKVWNKSRVVLTQRRKS